MDDIPFDLRALRVIIYEKNDPHWGEALTTKVEAAARETVRSPQGAVLPAFLHVREASGAPPVTPREKELIEIKQELDLVRRELRSRDEMSGRNTRILNRPAPDEALRMIRDWLVGGVPPSVIAGRLINMGVPPSFANEETRKLANEYVHRPRRESINSVLGEEVKGVPTPEGT